MRAFCLMGTRIAPAQRGAAGLRDSIWAGANGALAAAARRCSQRSQPTATAAWLMRPGPAQPRPASQLPRANRGPLTAQTRCPAFVPATRPPRIRRRCYLMQSLPQPPRLHQRVRLDSRGAQSGCGRNDRPFRSCAGRRQSSAARSEADATAAGCAASTPSANT